jgi:hypothetical protein
VEQITGLSICRELLSAGLSKAATFPCLLLEQYAAVRRGLLRSYPFSVFFRGGVKPPPVLPSLLRYLHLDASRLCLFDAWNA